VSMSQGGRLDFCVTGVTVDSNRHMIFAVTWTLSNIPGGYTVTKRSDGGNRNMYLIDNLGNRYDHSAGGGAAYSSVDVADGVPVSGWFDFGQPPVGAFTFDFHDDDNGIVISNISLYTGGGGFVSSIDYAKLLLDDYPLMFLYDKAKWDATKSDDGKNMLTNKAMPSCTIQAKPPTQPIGMYKSTTDVGNITYDIYGYFDESLNLFIREYIVSSQISGLDASTKPFFYVTIPADNSMACILDASDVLSSLMPQKP
jgi:hypothetical protein